MLLTYTRAMIRYDIELKRTFANAKHPYAENNTFCEEWWRHFDFHFQTFWRVSIFLNWDRLKIYRLLI